MGESLAAPPVKAGLRMPLVAPFGRDYVAWAGDRAIERWLKGIERRRPGCVNGSQPSSPKCESADT